MKRIVVLSNNDNSEVLYNWLVENGYEVKLYGEPITLEFIEAYQPELVISYNYKHMVKEDVINHMGDRIINMHTSYIPWNKGSSPNLWSFIDNTPKGVTIHRLEKGLDTGKIIVQKQLFFDESKETLASSYNKLNMEIVQLLKDNWQMLLSGEYTLKEHEGKGSYHRMADLEKLLKGRTIDYGMTIAEFREFIAE